MSNAFPMGAMCEWGPCAGVRTGSKELVYAVALETVASTHPHVHTLILHNTCKCYTYTCVCEDVLLWSHAGMIAPTLTSLLMSRGTVVLV